MLSVVIFASYLLGFKYYRHLNTNKSRLYTTFMALDDKPNIILTPMCSFDSKQYLMCFVSLGSDLIKYTVYGGM